MADLTQLSDADLKSLYTIHQQEAPGQPDSSTIKSPKGASGAMQVMPATQTQPGMGVKPSNGTPEDTVREGDDYFLALKNRYNGDPMTAAIAYNWGPGNTDKWLAEGADMSKVPGESLKYAYNFNKKNPQPTPTTASPDLSKMSDDDLKKAYGAQQSQPTPYQSPEGFGGGGDQQSPMDTKQQQVSNMLAQSRQQTMTGVNAVQGLGEAQAGMMTGVGAQAASGFKALYDIGSGQSQNVLADMNRIQQALTYTPKTPEGKAIMDRVSEGFGKMTDLMKQGAAITGSVYHIPREVTDTAAEVVANIGPMLMGLGGAKGVAERPGLGKAGGGGVPADALGKLTPDDAAAPSAQKPSEFVGPRQEGTGPLQDQPNAGPQRPIIVDTEGKALPAGQEPTMEQLGAEIGRERFGSKLAENAPVSEYNTAEARAGAIVRDPIETLDPTSETPHPAENVPAERVAAPEEFAQAVTTLAERSPDKFSVPADMDKAYDRYQKIVEGSLEPGKVAGEFVKAVAAQMAEDRVNNHPTIKANQARVDSLQSRLEAAKAANGPTSSIQSALDRANKTLDSAKDNIGKYFQQVDSATAPKVSPDGVVHMYTFGHLPTLMKSIGAILKALHGVVFKTLDRVLPSMKNLDSGPKIMAQGIKNFVNREATRDWSQTVNEKPIGQIGKVPGLREAVNTMNPFAQEDLSPQELKAQFNSAPDLSDSKLGNLLRNNILQGGLMLSDFSNHPLVKYVTDSVQKAFKTADKWTRENLLNKDTGLAQMQKDMPRQHYTEIRALMEANEGIKEFRPAELKAKGFTDQQIKYYTRSLELQKEAFQKYNAGRALAGLPPIDARIAHIAGYFTGDFKQIVKDSAGRVVAVLGHNNRAALGVIAKRFQELHPDGASLDMGTPFLRKGSMEDNTFHGMMNILSELSKTNADVDRIVQAYKDVQMANTNKLSQMADRAKFKTNPENRVGGAEGQKLWQSMEKNAQEGGKQQLKYLDSLNRWSEFQKAIQKSQEFISDPEVKAPNAKTVSQAYLDNQMHRNLGELNKFTNAISNGVAEITGVGPTQMRGIANFTKTGLLNMFVGLGKFSHSLVTTLQPFIGMPEVTSVMKARGMGIRPISQITSALHAMLDNKDILQSLITKQPIKDPFLRAANQYAKDNDTFNTSQFNMGSVNHPSSKLGTALHINVTVPESGARAFTYMRYVRLLKDASDHAPVGQKLSDQEIFGAAHNATQKVMADYNREAGPPIFNKMGFLGDLTRMLTTFKMNQISQAATATKMLTQGKVTPMITMLASSIASAGLRGFIGYNIANGLIGQITTWATKNGIMNQPTNLDQMLLHMLHGTNPHLHDALLFGATAGLGIDMTGSLSHADDLPDDPLGTLFPEGNPLGKMMGSAVQFAEHPNAQRGKAMLYNALPNSAKGIMENMAYTDEQGRYYDPNTGNLVTTRTPTDQAKRAFSFRPLEQSKERLVAETDREHEQQLSAVKSEIVKRMLSDADSKSLTQADVHNYTQRYVQAGGAPDEVTRALVQHLGMDKVRNLQQREQGLARGLPGAEHYVRSEELK